MTAFITREDARDYADFGPDPVKPDMEGVPLQVERTCHWRKCPTCNGMGRIGFNLSHNNDPAAYDEAACPNPECEDGGVVVWRDPTYRLRDARRWARSAPRGAMHYGEARAEVVSPVLLPDSRQMARWAQEDAS